MNDQPTIKYSYLFDSKPLSIENIKGEKSGFPPYQACDTPEQARNVAKREWESQRTALEKKDLTWQQLLKGKLRDTILKATFNLLVRKSSKTLKANTCRTLLLCVIFIRVFPHMQAFL